MHMLANLRIVFFVCVDPLLRNSKKVGHKTRLIVDVFLKGDSLVDYLDRLHDILHQEDGLQLRQNVVQPAVHSRKNSNLSKFVRFNEQRQCIFVHLHLVKRCTVYTLSFKLYKSDLRGKFWRSAETTKWSNGDCH